MSVCDPWALFCLLRQVRSSWLGVIDSCTASVIPEILYHFSYWRVQAGMHICMFYQSLWVCHCEDVTFDKEVDCVSSSHVHRGNTSNLRNSQGEINGNTSLALRLSQPISNHKLMNKANAFRVFQTIARHSFSLVKSLQPACCKTIATWVCPYSSSSLPCSKL